MRLLTTRTMMSVGRRVRPVSERSQVIRVADIAGLAEVATLCDVSLQRVWNWNQRRWHDFPTSVTTLRATQVWDLGEVREWLALNRQHIRAS